MKPCNAVDRKACHNCHIGHAHLSVIDNGHLADLLLISRIAGLDLIYKAAVDLLHDLIDTGEQPGEQVNGPLLQSLGHNGMIGVGTGLCGNIPCFLPGQSLFIQKDTHQLRDRNRRMGII